jgi:hypothetical protein
MVRHRHGLRSIMAPDATDEPKPSIVGGVVSALLKFRIDFLKLRDSGKAPSWVTDCDGALKIAMTPRMREAAETLRHLFEARFGRHMEPDDPLFFDPYESEPTTFQGEHLAAAITSLASEMGMKPAELFAKLDWLSLLEDYERSQH